MASSAPSSLDAATSSLALLELEADKVEILATSYDNAHDDLGAVAEVINVYFRLLGLPGTFSVQVPATQNWNAIAFFYVGEKAAQVRAIYLGLASTDQLPEPGPYLTPAQAGAIIDAGLPLPQPGAALTFRQEQALSAAQLPLPGQTEVTFPHVQQGPPSPTGPVIV